MWRTTHLIYAALTALAIVSPQSATAAEAPTAAQIEFFETRIRPVLIEKCYGCHNSAKLAEGEFAADSRDAFLKGGTSGKVIVPGKPAESRLLAILRHEVDGVKMPQGLGKLDARVITDFEKWIAMGTPDPRDQAPSEVELTKATSWETTLAKRKQWWSFQPIRALPAPVIPDNKWSDHPVDRFVLAKLREQQLEPAQQADPGTLIRRLYFTLIGLPPTGAEVEFWTNRLKGPRGIEDLVDHLLASPQFGEHWARHWMDWIRYADSHGSEGDPTIENGWHFRDYLIRALNSDVPYDQLVREQIAGDLLEQPRINKQLGINESLIGPAHWRMVFHGFAPTDALDEKVRFIDDEINTFSKAFLGLTVSCARCHDHKFDPISQKDYYALFGILGSCRPSRVAIDTPDKLNANRDQLTALKPQIRTAIANEWLAAVPRLRGLLTADDGPWKKADTPKLLLNPVFQLRKSIADGATFDAAWKGQVDGWNNDRRQREEHAKRTYWKRWNLTLPEDYATWFRDGTTLPDKPLPAGDFALSAAPDNVLTGIYPAGIYSHRLSAKHVARLESGYVRLDDNYELWVRALGEGGASVRYVVQDYPRNGTVFPITQLTPEWSWQRFDLTYWNSDDIHVEITAGKDAPLMVNNSPRSWFGIREAIIVRKGDPAPSEPREFLDPVFELSITSPPASLNDLADRYVAAVTAAVKAWQVDSITDAQAHLLNACLKQGLLPNHLDGVPSARQFVTEYRRLEEEIVVSTRVPGLEETTGRDQPLMTRGNHKQLSEAVPRRFLEAIDATPYKTTNSGRLQLADDLLRDDNPLTRRVIVNRLWHHVFGRGIVPTPDNFGRLGQEPTHPELVDYLASVFKEQHWSIKAAIRSMVTSNTWQLASQPSPRALLIDPDNRLLSHANVRRLEAESIRDSLLAVSGRLLSEQFGGPVDGNANRRSVYVRVQRNALDPFLRAFDFPEPFTTTGRRDATNVPAQSLTMLNDPRVAELASSWASSVLSDKQLASDEARIQSMFMRAFGRPAQSGEVTQLQSYLSETKANYAKVTEQIAGLRQQIDQRQSAINKLLEPVRTRLIEQAKTKTAAGEQVVPKPISLWEFEGDLQDAIGPAHGVARGGAQVENGTLVVSQQAHVITAPIKQNIKAKTLEAWVQLGTLDQSGGGVMTIQTPDGVVFDAIVFAEQAPRQWMAGSDGFNRTLPFNGPADQDAAKQSVHLAIVYHEDGRIVGYRNGQPYGKPYQSRGPVEFKAGSAVIGFGIRHLPAGGNRMLSGRILRAQLYDRALTADEIQATSQSAPYFVSEAQVIAALSESDRASIASARQHIRTLEAEISALGSVPELGDGKAVWTELAHTLFTFKEFIYLR
ncbi:MAG: hypothetical protein JWN70_3833 [Planctomycetaceae bacterium]|nr:hypothetical protein [Planctomycetaceae bacterium]